MSPYLEERERGVYKNDLGVREDDNRPFGSETTFLADEASKLTLNTQVVVSQGWGETPEPPTPGKSEEPPFSQARLARSTVRGARGSLGPAAPKLLLQIASSFRGGPPPRRLCTPPLSKARGRWSTG